MTLSRRSLLKSAAAVGALAASAEVFAPAIAQNTPLRSSDVHGHAAALNATVIGTARRKFPAVVAVASAAPFPRNE